mgnify:CR=1 FL=1
MDSQNFFHNFLKIKNIIDSSSANLYFKGFVWYTKGIYNNGSHMINLIEFWLGPIKQNCYKLSGSLKINEFFEKPLPSIVIPDFF